MNKTQIKKYLKENAETGCLGEWKLGIPTIACWQIDEIHIAFFCKHCNQIHKHGLGNGHRSAHCHGNNDSPYLKTGYYLVNQGNLGNLPEVEE